MRPSACASRYRYGSIERCVLVDPGLRVVPPASASSFSSAEVDTEAGAAIVDTKQNESEVGNAGSGSKSDDGEPRANRSPAGGRGSEAAAAGGYEGDGGTGDAAAAVAVASGLDDADTEAGSLAGSLRLAAADAAAYVGDDGALTERRRSACLRFANAEARARCLSLRTPWLPLY